MGSLTRADAAVRADTLSVRSYEFDVDLFNQPDLKAPVTLRVRADPRWLVCANCDSGSTAAGRWEFLPAPPLPTYRSGAGG